MTELRSCSNCRYRQTCNLDGLTAKTCGIWSPRNSGEYLLKWARSLRQTSEFLLTEAITFSNQLHDILAELSSERVGQQRGR